MASKFVVAVPKLSKAEIDEARKNSGSYSGPIPPEGTYNVKFVNMSMWQCTNESSTYNGRYQLRVFLRIEDDEYKGCPVNAGLWLPDQRIDGDFYALRITQLDDMISAIFQGNMDASEFFAALNSGKVIVGDPDSRNSQKVEKVAQFVMEKVQSTFRTELKHNTYKDNTRMEVRRVLFEKPQVELNSAEEDFSDLEGLEI